MIKLIQVLKTMFSLTLVLCLVPYQAIADTAERIDNDVDSALSRLYAKIPAAKTLGRSAKGVLVFPRIVKAGFIVGGQYGEGALRVNGETKGYYNTAAASFGLQAGAESFGYALFFMTNSAIKYLEASSGWELGVGPSIVIIDTGAAGSFSTTTAKSDVYAFFFDQKGLMAGINLQGSKISRIVPNK